MADISTELQAIKDAVYGEEVRGAIVDALDAMNEIDEDAEAFAAGTRGGTAVESTDPAYHNNAKYYAEQAATSAATFETDTTLAVSGKAADSKTAGDAISAIDEKTLTFVATADLPATFGADDLLTNHYYYIHLNAGTRIFSDAPDEIADDAYIALICQSLNSAGNVRRLTLYLPLEGTTYVTTHRRAGTDVDPYLWPWKKILDSADATTIGSAINAVDDKTLSFFSLSGVSSFGIADIPVNSFCYVTLNPSTKIFTDRPDGISNSAYISIVRTPINSAGNVSRVTVSDVLNGIYYVTTFRNSDSYVFPWKKLLTNNDSERIDAEISMVTEDTDNLLDPVTLIPDSSDVTITFGKDKFTVSNSSSGTYKRACAYLHLDTATKYSISAIKTTVTGSSGIFYRESEDEGETYSGGWSTLVNYTDSDGEIHSKSFVTTTGYVQIGFFCAGTTSAQGEAVFENVMLVKGSVQQYTPTLTAVDYIARNGTQPKLNTFTCRIFKRVMCVGDSYTEGWINTTGTGHAYKEYSWPTYMETITGNKWLNFGVSGATAKSWLGLDPNKPNDERLTEAQEAGLVQAYVIQLMINDTSISVGDAEDIGDENPSTYYGYYSMLVRELHAISPKAVIFCCTCPYLGNNREPYQQAVRDIVEEYATDYNAKLLDMKKDANLFKNSSLTDDRINAHYTALGYEQFAEIYAWYISNYINNHVSEFQNVFGIPYDN